MLAAKTYLHIVNVMSCLYFIRFMLHKYIDSSVKGRGTRIISCINENATGSDLPIKFKFIIYFLFARG